MSTFLTTQEEFKFVIDFSNEDPAIDDYVITTLDTDEKIITNLSADFIDAIRNTGRISALSSSNMEVTVYDFNDYLSNSNPNSPWVNKLVEGRKVHVYKCEYDLTKTIEGQDWQSYGTWYLTEPPISGFEEGVNKTSTILLADVLDQLGGMDMTNAAYNGSTAQAALEFIFTAFGLTSSDWNIDSSIGLSSIPYTYLQEGRASNTINDIATLSLMYITVGHDGKIYVRNGLELSSATVDHNLESNFGPIDALSSQVSSFSKIKINAPDGDGRIYQELAEENQATIENGDNTFNISLKLDIISVEDVTVDITGNATDYPIISDLSWEANQNSINVHITADIQEAVEGNIKVFGLAKSGREMKTQTIDIPGGSTSTHAETYEYTASNFITNAEMLAIAEKIKLFIMSLRTQIVIGTSLLSANIQVGDIAQISGVSDTYNGKYRISEFKLERSQDSYNTSLTLVKLIEQEDET